MTILLVTLASIIFTFLLYLVVNYKRVDISTKGYYKIGLGFSYNRFGDHASIFRILILDFQLKITVWDEIRDLPF